jgi:hypothetical protein
VAFSAVGKRVLITGAAIASQGQSGAVKVAIDFR